MACSTGISVFSNLEKAVHRIIGLSYHESAFKIRCRVTDFGRRIALRNVSELAPVKVDLGGKFVPHNHDHVFGNRGDLTVRTLHLRVIRADSCKEYSGRLRHPLPKHQLGFFPRRNHCRPPHGTMSFLPPLTTILCSSLTAFLTSSGREGTGFFPCGDRLRRNPARQWLQHLDLGGARHAYRGGAQRHHRSWGAKAVCRDPWIGGVAAESAVIGGFSTRVNTRQFALFHSRAARRRPRIQSCAGLSCATQLSQPNTDATVDFVSGEKSPSKLTPGFHRQTAV